LKEEGSEEVMLRKIAVKEEPRKRAVSPVESLQMKRSPRTESDSVIAESDLAKTEEFACESKIDHEQFGMEEEAERRERRRAQAPAYSARARSKNSSYEA
jgi:hypothetical protein